MSELFPELATPGGVTGHAIDDDARMGFVPRAPIYEYVVGTLGSNVAGVINNYIDLMSGQKEDVAWAFRQTSIKYILDRVEEIMPEGEPFVVYIHESGTDREEVVVLSGPFDPERPSLGQGNGFGTPTDNRTIAGVGRGNKV